MAKKEVETVEDLIKEIEKSDEGIALDGKGEEEEQENEKEDDK
jgi:hypothetical protein